MGKFAVFVEKRVARNKGHLAGTQEGILNNICSVGLAHFKRGGGGSIFFNKVFDAVSGYIA